MKSLAALTTLLLLPMFVGCGASLPTEDAAKKYIQQDIQKDHPVNLVNFHKTNAQQGRNQMGVENYVMEYESEIEFTEDCFWYGGLHATLRRDEFASWGATKVKKGQHEKAFGKVYFDKTENGWRPSGRQDRVVGPKPPRDRPESPAK